MLAPSGCTSFLFGGTFPHGKVHLKKNSSNGAEVKFISELVEEITELRGVSGSISISSVANITVSEGEGGDE